MDERGGDLFDRLASEPVADEAPREPIRFFGHFRRNPALLLFALAVLASVWVWIASIGNLYAEYHASRPDRDASDGEDAGRDILNATEIAGASGAVLAWVAAAIAVAACVVAGLLFAHSRSAAAPVGTMILGVGLVVGWAFVAVLLRSVVASSIADFAALSGP